jgi:putative tricarboxylic transport membrane protein
MAGLGIALVARPAAAGSPSTDCPSRWRSFAIGMGTLVFYVLALEPLGYLAATFGLLLVQCRWVEGRSWRGSLLIAVAAAVISLLVFRALLKVPLPLGILPPPPW